MYAAPTDLSTGSYDKSSSRNKFSNSYASSNAASGPVETFNFSFEEIIKATEKFSPANIIGEGGFGTVYKGRLGDGTMVAVKRAKRVLISIAMTDNGFVFNGKRVGNLCKRL